MHHTEITIVYQDMTQLLHHSATVPRQTCLPCRCSPEAKQWTVSETQWGKTVKLGTGCYSSTSTWHWRWHWTLYIRDTCDVLSNTLLFLFIFWPKKRFIYGIRICPHISWNNHSHWFVKVVWLKIIYASPRAQTCLTFMTISWCAYKCMYIYILYIHILYTYISAHARKHQSHAANFKHTSEPCWTHQLKSSQKLHWYILILSNKIDPGSRRLRW